MDLIIDHAVIVVNDLASAIKNYSTLGFTVVPGGEHADGSTHNALIAFSDGAYIELIAFKGEPPEGHPFGRAVKWGGGLVTYALLPTDIERTIAEARERSLHLDGPIPGGRICPDGQQISWQTARPTTFDLPFLCADVTPRDRRVPSGEARQHANGVLSIAGITVVVSDYSASARRYLPLLGEEELVVSQGVAIFQVGETKITLIQPSPFMPLSEGPMREYLDERGDVPYSLTLSAADGSPVSPIDPALTSGVRLGVTHEAAIHRGKTVIESSLI